MNTARSIDARNFGDARDFGGCGAADMAAHRSGRIVL